MSKTALINGVTGQDGTYLAEYLVGKKYRVIGCVRNLHHTPHHNTGHVPRGVELVQWDMQYQGDIERILGEYRPDEFYNLAAYSSGTNMYENAAEIGRVNGLSVVYMLEAIRKINVNTRFCQASSREVFGEASITPQTEETPRRPRSPYGAAKLFADNMVDIYRREYGLHASSAILYNHESPRRGVGFVSRKITHAVAQIKYGLSDGLKLGNLASKRDWGYAADYVRAMWLMLQQSNPDDYILATGKVHTVAEFCERAFSCASMDYKKHVLHSDEFYRQEETVDLAGCAEKARRELGWVPEVDFDRLVEMMVENDMRLFEGGIIK